MSQYTIQQIASVISCNANITSNASIEHLVIDTRKMVWYKTSLFFAIKTKTNNGHAFIANAYNAGVFNFVVENDFNIQNYPNANFLLVQNVVQALQQLATYHRKQFNIPVIGITGSNGKTIVKEWLYQLLQQDFSIVRSPKSFNSQIGVPLSIWQMNSHHNLAIIEVGISQPNEMDCLEDIVKPTIGIFTYLGDAHSSSFTSQQQKFEEKWKLFNNATQIIANLHGITFTEQTKNKVLNASVQHYFAQKVDKHTKITALIEGKSYNFNIPFLDEASVQNCFTCCLTLATLNYSEAEINKRITELQHLQMRLQLQNATNNCLIVNDTYTNDYSAFITGLDFLQQNKSNKETVVILSEFIDVIVNKQAFYKQLAEVIVANKIGVFIGIGADMLMYKKLLTNAASETYFFETTSNFLQSPILKQLKNQIIYVKGARVFTLEKVVQQLQQKNHQTQLQINLNALSHNLKTIKQTLQPTTHIMAMVKAFGYGSGSEEVAKLLQYNNVQYLAVAYADEGVALRKTGIYLPIMVLNVDEDNFNDLVEYNLEPEIFSFSLLNKFIGFLQLQGLQQYPIHLKVNTGMNRLGFEVEEVDEIIKVINSTSLIKLKSVFTHLASSDNVLQDDFTFKQQQLFDDFCSQLKQHIYYHFLQHIANTAAIIRLPQLQYNMVRLGIALYGIQNTKNELPLQTVATLTTTIAQIRKVKKGESVGYNRKSFVEEDSLIATIRIGYADGLSRQLSNGVGSVWIKGKLAPIIGSVCMDMTMVNITHIAEANEGDLVEIFGHNISINDVAKHSNTIAYETLSTINQRVKRIYVQD